MIWQKINKPDFFLVGAAKSGTTSIDQYFRVHPSIYVSPIKEPNYFGSDINPKNFSPRFLEIYPNDLTGYFEDKPLKVEHFAFVDREEDFERLFEENTKNLVSGECSSSYLYSTKAAQEIADFNPEAKIIISLRNPIDRAYSHYLMAVQLGMVTGSFVEEFEKDRLTDQKGFGRCELFFELGMYAQQVKRYQDIFGKDRVLVVLFEDWIKNQKLTQENICQFLNVPIFTAADFESANVSKSVRNTGLHQKLMRSSIKEKVMSVLPSAVKQKVKQLYYKNEKTVLSSEEREMLLSLYRDDMLKTQELIKLDLNNWLKI